MALLRGEVELPDEDIRNQASKNVEKPESVSSTPQSRPTRAEFIEVRRERKESHQDGRNLSESPRVTQIPSGVVEHSDRVKRTYHKWQKLSPAAKTAAAEMGEKVIEIEKSLEEKSSLYSIGKGITKRGEDIASTVKRILPLEKIPGGEFAEESVAGIVEAPLKGVGSFTQAMSLYEIKLKGEDLTEEEFKVLGSAAKITDRLMWESIAADAGIRAAGKAVGKVIDKITFRNKKFIPIEELTQKGVVEGKVNFPKPTKVGDGEAIVKQFYESSSIKHTDIGKSSKVSGFHATSQARGPAGTGKGFITHSEISRPKDMPGLYIAPDVSPHFLRISEGVGYSLIPKPRNPFKRPGVLQVGVDDVIRLPKEIRRDIKKAQEFMKSGAEKGKAYVTPEAELGKPEAEAVITPSTPVVNIRGKSPLGGRFEYYTEWKGKKVPLYEMKAVGDDVEKTVAKMVKETGEIKKPLREVAEEYSLKPEEKWIFSEALQRAAVSKFIEKYKPPESVYKTPSYKAPSSRRPVPQSALENPLTPPRRMEPKPSRPKPPKSPTGIYKPPSEPAPPYKVPSTPYKPPSTPLYEPYEPVQPYKPLTEPVSPKPPAKKRGKSPAPPPGIDFDFDPLKDIDIFSLGAGIKYNPVAEDPFKLPKSLESVITDFTKRKKFRL